MLLYRSEIALRSIFFEYLPDFWYPKGEVKTILVSEVKVSWRNEGNAELPLAKWGETLSYIK